MYRYTYIYIYIYIYIYWVGPLPMLAPSSCLGSERFLLLCWQFFACPYIWTRLRDFLLCGGRPFADRGHAAGPRTNLLAFGGRLVHRWGCSPCWVWYACVFALCGGRLFADHAFVVGQAAFLSLFASVKAWPSLWTVWAVLLLGRGSFSNMTSTDGMGGVVFSSQAGR